MTIGKPDAYRTASFRLPECTDAHDHHPALCCGLYATLLASRASTSLIFLRPRTAHDPSRTPLATSLWNDASSNHNIHSPRIRGSATYLHLSSRSPSSFHSKVDAAFSSPESQFSTYALAHIHPPFASSMSPTPWTFTHPPTLRFRISWLTQTYGSTRASVHALKCEYWRCPLVIYTASRTSRQPEPCFFIVITPWHPHQRRRRRSAQLRVSSQPTCHDTDIIDSTVITFLLSFVLKTL